MSTWQELVCYHIVDGQSHCGWQHEALFGSYVVTCSDNLKTRKCCWTL